MGYIIFATGRRVTIATAITGNAGTSTYSFRIRSGPNGITVPSSGLAGFIGTSQATGSNGLVVNASGQIRVYRSGTNLYGSTSALITSGVQFDYTLSHTAGTGAWDIFNNLTGTPTGESGTYTTAQLWANGTNGLNQLGRSSSTNTVYLVGDMEIIAVTGLTNSQEYDASLSGGTGLTLPTTSGVNQGTLDGFGATDADNWGGFGPSATFAGTLPKLTAAISATVTSGISATFSGTLPKLTAAISANVTSGISASFAGALPKLRASINATVSTGTDSLSFSGTLPKLTASISATVSAPPNSLSFAGTLPKLRASISATVSLPPPLVAFSGTLPRLRMQAAMIVQVPEPAGDPLALKQALVNARRAEENRNNEYVPPVVIVPEWYIIQQRALGLKQGEVNRARDEE
jgi:hypothetical protein